MDKLQLVLVVLQTSFNGNPSILQCLCKSVCFCDLPFLWSRPKNAPQGKYEVNHFQVVLSRNAIHFRILRDCTRRVKVAPKHPFFRAIWSRYKKNFDSESNSESMQASADRVNKFDRTKATTRIVTCGRHNLRIPSTWFPVDSDSDSKDQSPTTC
jgi:hypothetical protein